MQTRIGTMEAIHEEEMRRSQAVADSADRLIELEKELATLREREVRRSTFNYNLVVLRVLL